MNKIQIRQLPNYFPSKSQFFDDFSDISMYLSSKTNYMSIIMFWYLLFEKQKQDESSSFCATEFNNHQTVQMK